MNIQFHLKYFDNLSPQELYSILQLRNEVFVVEQNCVFQDADDKDQKCYHLMGTRNGSLLAYTRIVPPGWIYEQASIGRVVTSPKARRENLGKELMKRSIESVYDLFGKVDIKIGAQKYLKRFYESFDFKQVSDVYLEDGIEHIYMIRHTS